MFKRSSEKILSTLAQFPAVTILGPRQSGKTTLAKAAFPDHAFVSFDLRSDRAFAEEDPTQFFRIYDNEHGIIIDEFQYVPSIVEHIKYLIDTKTKKPGYFVLTGSENYLTQNRIKESLAGRTGILTLLPLSINELVSNNLISASTSVEEVIFSGGYPRIYAENLSVYHYYSTYSQTYLDRDVAWKIAPANLTKFRNFLEMCAGRTGQVINNEAFSNELGVSSPTIEEWLLLLRDNYIIFSLPSFAKSIDKKIAKRPKLYFWDTGLACELLGIKRAEGLYRTHYYGALFENLIVADLHKQYYNLGEKGAIYFYKEGQYEVDCLIEEQLHRIPIEIKASETIIPQLFKGLNDYVERREADPVWNYLVYGGSQNQELKQGHVVGWQAAGSLIKTIQTRIYSGL